MANKYTLYNMGAGQPGVFLPLFQEKNQKQYFAFLYLMKCLRHQVVLSILMIVNKSIQTIEYATIYNRIRHRENLQRAENSRIGRIYHSQQVGQNGKMSCLCSDFRDKTKKVPSAHKKKENVTENFDIQKYYRKNEPKNIQNDS